jgi:hypothetical protein
MLTINQETVMEHLIPQQFFNSNPETAVTEKKSMRASVKCAIETSRHQKIFALKKEISDARIRWHKSGHKSGWRTFEIFLFVTTIATALEPFLVGIDASWGSQVAVLFASIVLFFIGVFATASFLTNDKTFLQRIWQCLDNEVQIEGYLLLYGVISIFAFEDFAPLRCFRVVRIFFFINILQKENDVDYYPEDNFFSVMKSCELCYKYLLQVQMELMSENSKGAAVVLMMFFYITFVVSSVAYYAGSDIEAPACDTASHCFITIMRLSFYDGNGFDYLNGALDAGRWGLFIVLVVHMCGSSMIFLNGLIGIFGDAFSSDAHDDDSDNNVSIKNGDDKHTDILGSSKFSGSDSDGEVCTLLKKLDSRMISLENRLASVIEMSQNQFRQPTSTSASTILC